MQESYTHELLYLSQTNYTSNRKAPSLLCEVASLVIDVIDDMSQDYLALMSLIKKNKQSGNRHGVKICSEALRRYQAGFLVNLELIISCSLQLIDKIQIPARQLDNRSIQNDDSLQLTTGLGDNTDKAHIIFSADIRNKEQELKTLLVLFALKQCCEGYFKSHCYHPSRLNMNWQDSLLNDLIAISDLSYQELIDILTPDRKYSYSELNIMLRNLMKGHID